MNLDSVVEKLLNTNAPSRMRAIDLFEFQVSIFYPRAYEQGAAATNITRSASKKLRSARILASTKVLDLIEGELRSDPGGLPASLRQLADDTIYCTIFDDVVTPNGGWMRLRHSPSAEAFDRRMEMRRSGSVPAAKVIDFAFRYSLEHPSPARPPKKTAARYVVRMTPSYDERLSDRTMKGRWTPYSKTPVFLWLLMQDRFPLMPPRLSSKSFLTKLLEQADNIEMLRRFFREYQEICKVLRPWGYRFPELTIDLKLPPPEIPVAKLPDDALAAFERAGASDAAEHRAPKRAVAT